MTYKPAGGAATLWKCRDREVLMDGPAGTGKTRACLEKVDACCRKWPGMRALLVRKTRVSLSESVQVIYENDVLPDDSMIAVGQKRNYRKLYEYPNGSSIVLGGLDNVDRIMSTAYDLIVIGEATECTLNDYEMLLTRLRNGKMPFHQIVCECNPSYPRHWLKARADDNRMTRIMSRHEDNPSVTEEYLKSLGSLTGHRRNRLLLGQWVAAEGIIYEAWDAAKHVQRRTEKKWKRAIIGVDDGYTNPCSVHVYLLDYDGRVHVAEESYLTQQLEDQTASRLKALVDKHNAEAVIIDPSAAKLIARCENDGLPVREANNDVFGGIRICQQRLVIPGDGIPRLTVDPSCKFFLQEIEGYAWKENRNGELEDKPIKENDHAMDEWRYSMMYLDEASISLQAFVL